MTVLLARRARRRVLVVVTAVLSALVITAGCASSTPSYDAGLWPQRPTVELAFTVAPDLHTATGRESVTFLSLIHI